MRELRSRGITLLETLVVVSILGIVAVAAIPGFRSAERQQLELAAELFAEAMRFARSEALRSGQPRGFRQAAGSRRLQLFRADSAEPPWTPVFDVYHPVSRKRFDIDLDAHPFASADSLSATPTFRGSCSTPGDIYFDAGGVPWCRDPETVLLEQLDLTLTLGAHTRLVRLDGLTGRVTLP